MAESRFNDGDLEKQVAELSDHIANMGQVDLLCSTYDTSGTTERTLNDGKKFSEYRYVYIVLWYNRLNSAQNMASNIVPIDLFKTWSYASVARAYVGTTHHAVGVKYVSDTTCNAFVTDTADECRVYGIK